MYSWNNYFKEAPKLAFEIASTLREIKKQIIFDSFKKYITNKLNKMPELNQFKEIQQHEEIGK